MRLKHSETLYCLRASLLLSLFYSAQAGKFCREDKLFCAEGELINVDEALFRLTTGSKGWSAIGITRSDGMHDCDPMIVWQHENGTAQVQDSYTVYTNLFVDTEQDISFLKSYPDASDPSRTVFEFKRKLKTGDKNDIDIEANKEQSWVFAISNNKPAPYVDHHSWVKVVKMALVGSVAPVAELDSDTLKIGNLELGNVEIHGILMTIAWSVVLPFSGLIARNRKRLGPGWLLFHRALSIISALMIMTSAYLIFPLVSNHLLMPHHVLGVSANSLLLAVQLPLGNLIDKSKAPKQATLISNGKIHRAVGVLLAVVSSAAIYSGLQLYGVEISYLRAWYAVQFAVWPLLFILFSPAKPVQKSTKSK